MVTTEPDAALQRLDGFPYVHRVSEIMVAPVLSAPPDTRLLDVIEQLRAQHSSSCIVSDMDGKAIGIVTERDVLNAIGRFSADALQQPISAYMSTPVEWVPPDALLYRAIARMDRRQIRHLAVLDAEGRPLGMLTVRVLFRVRAGRSLAIGDAVEVAGDAAALRAAHDELPVLAAGLAGEGIAARDVSGVISAITRDITARAAKLAELAMIEAGEGPAPAPWCLLVLGSGGRSESLLAPDQDNALIVDESGAAQIDGWFARWADRINTLLDQAGIPLCKGGVMARNRSWRRTSGEWRAEIARWISLPQGEALLNVDIFYDAVPVAGEAALALRLRADALAAAARAPLFLRLLAENAESWRPPLGLFGRFQLEDGRLDLKKGGLLPIVSAARVMALRHGLPATGTRERLLTVAERGAIGRDNAEAFSDAREIIVEAILGQQLEDLRNARPAGNTVDPRRLNRSHRDALRQALQRAGEAATLVQDVLTS